MRFLKLISTIILLMSSVEAFALESDYIKGVSKEQWSVIKKIGDPLNCEERVAKIDNLVSKIKTTANGSISGSKVSQRIYAVDLEAHLNAAGYNVGKLDKEWEKKDGTRLLFLKRALKKYVLKRYLQDNSFPRDTRITAELFKAIRASLGDKAPPLKGKGEDSAYFIKGVISNSWASPPVYLITAEKFNKQKVILKRSLEKNKITVLDTGEYNIDETIQVRNGAILVGKEGVIINSSKVDNAFIINLGSIKNLTIYNAQQVGVMVEKEATVYNVVIKNTGVDSSNNSYGNGVLSTGSDSHSNCIVSVEAFNGYNEIAKFKVTSKGGNADGFAAKFGAHDITFIDTHGHHNSDDGYDFWKSGDDAPIKTKEPTIRIFYSSANLNGKNPLTPNGDGNGFKFGSRNKYSKPKRDKGARLIYGSVACYNTENGFDRNGTPMKVIGMNLSAKGNGRKGYEDVSNKRSSDKFKLKCKMFPRK